MQAADLLDTLVEDGRIVHLESSDIRLVYILRLLLLEILLARQELTHQQDSQDDAHHPQRIGHRTAQGRRSGIHAQLLQRLLGCAKSGRIGRGPTEDTHHVRQGDIQSPTAQQGHQRTHQHHGNGQHIELHASAAE